MARYTVILKMNTIDFALSRTEKWLKEHNIVLNSLEWIEEGMLVQLESKDFGAEELRKLLSEQDNIDSVNVLSLDDQFNESNTFYALANLFNAGVVVMDESLSISYMNGISKDLFVDKLKITNASIFEDLDISDADVSSMVAGFKAFKNQYMSAMINNRIVSYVMSGEPILLEDGSIKGYILGFSAFNDIKKIRGFKETDEEVLSEIIGSSSEIDVVRERCKYISLYSQPVTILGESGTKKSHYAKIIHRLSSRKYKPFLKIITGELHPNLIERELFGYDSGLKVLGASRPGKEGLIVKADGGTLFIGNVENLSTRTQEKLLEYIKSGKLCKVDSDEFVYTDTRIIMSSNEGLEEKVNMGIFNKELFSEIMKLKVMIPPLRSRKGDLPAIVNDMIQTKNFLMKKQFISADIEFYDEISKYSWPGNERELEMLVEITMEATTGDIIQHKDLFNSSYIDGEWFDPLQDLSTEKINLKLILENEEQRLISKALHNCTSLIQAAESLSISYSTLQNKIKKYNLKV